MIICEYIAVLLFVINLIQNIRMIPNNEQQKPMVENISCILPANDQLGGLFLGNVYGAQNSEILKEYGIRAVITASA
jgi:hypothetical protein